MILFYGSFVLGAMFMVSTFLLGRKVRIGWLVTIIADIAAALYDGVTNQPGLAIISVGMTVVAFNAWRKWKVI